MQQAPSVAPRAAVQASAQKRSFLERALDWLIALVVVILLCNVGAEDISEEERAAALGAAAAEVQEQGLAFPLALDLPNDPLPADVQITIASAGDQR